MGKRRKTKNIEEAENRSKEIAQGTIEYADEMLSNVENTLRELLETISKNRKELK